MSAKPHKVIWRLGGDYLYFKYQRPTSAVFQEVEQDLAARASSERYREPYDEFQVVLAGLTSGIYVKQDCGDV